MLPALPAGYADTYVNGVRYRVRTVEIRAPEPMSVAVGATYDATIADTNNLHRRVLIICSLRHRRRHRRWAGCLRRSRCARSSGWRSRPGRSTPVTRHPNVEVQGATEAVEIADAIKGMLQRIWKEQDRHQGGAGVGARLLGGVRPRIAHAA